MKPIRNSAKAIIIKDGKLLTTKNQGKTWIFHLLPGGGQEFGETLHETLKRECREEIGGKVEIGELLWIREYRGWKHEFAEFEQGEHTIEFMFMCSLKSGVDEKVASQPDTYQIGVEWIKIEAITKYRFYPQVLKPLIKSINNRKVSPIYLGDVN